MYHLNFPAKVFVDKIQNKIQIKLKKKEEKEILIYNHTNIKLITTRQEQ